ncbi:MAG: hypothetical protein ACRDRI_07970 [Pseudonocardiaceae bacterium]
MSTDPAPHRGRPPTDRARVWLIAGLGTAPTPTDRPTVRDDLMRTWQPGPNGYYTTRGGRHHATRGELRARHVAVLRHFVRCPLDTRCRSWPRTRYGLDLAFRHRPVDNP